MNELKFMHGTNGDARNKLVLTVWNDDTQQVVARNVNIIELFGSEVEAGENEVRGGRFTRWDGTLSEHVVEFKTKIRAPYQRRLNAYLEWINENTEGRWAFGFRDESCAVSAWGLLSFDLYLRFYFESVEDALLFKLRWL